MGVLRVFLMAVAGAFAAIAVIGVGLITKGWFVTGLILAAGGGALAYAVFKQARTYTIQSTDNQQQQFEATVRALAQKNDGVVALTAVMNATGYPKDRANQKMRELIGRGLFDLDFGENGELRFKLTPIDEARAQLAGMQDNKQLPP